LAGRKFGKFGESSMIHQTKTIQISTYNYNLLAETIDLPNFFPQMLKPSKFAKLSLRQTFPPYSNQIFLWHRGDHKRQYLYQTSTSLVSNMKFE